MLHGVLRRKFELTEDQLTSTVLSYLELLPDAVFLRWLSCAVSMPVTAPKLSFSSTARVEFWAWPRTQSHGEPDLLTLIRDGSVDHAVVVEVKYGASKSQWDSVLDADDDNLRLRYDQLARYGLALRDADFPDVVDRQRVHRARHAVVYLTPHAAPPLDELKESHEQAPELRLLWLSWHSLAETLDTEHPEDETQRRVVHALVRLMAKLGFGLFTGFSTSAKPPCAPELMWHFDDQYFVMDPSWRIDPGGVWRFSEKEFDHEPGR
jgi:hypothetical protein